ncbi:MAG TPA: tRNA (guanosine(46)-N7)-methyltransferase TrmB [Mycobacteriales bacterium]|jgi:tRNA (guanine-N7-)-methyltransferase|nr:tRNA (guanosine(46)-N7)-methyltransferase TrmB [Mycobacteriales bacterium]
MREPVPQRIRAYEPLQTFRLRRGRVSATQAEALDRLWPRWGVDVDGRPLDLAALFGPGVPVVLDVGSGMGEATAAAALADPARGVLAVDVHTPGLGALLRLAERAGLDNVRVADGDARVLLADMLAPASLDEVRVWFPDPWPKARHAKRRLLTPGFVALVADRLRPGGRLHVATDWPPYADAARAAVEGCADLEVMSTARPATRPLTRFEQQGLDAGRPAYDLVARRG